MFNIPIDHILQPLAGAIGLAAYTLLLIGILRSHVEQSFAAFLLWAMLDGIAAVATLIEGGNFWLAFSNMLGSGTITAILVIKKQVSWSKIETATSVLVVICLVTWYAAGGQAGIIASSLAVFTASIPQMADTWKKPATTPVTPYLVFLAANLLSLFAGRSWTIEERFYPACSVALTVIIVAFAMRKKRAR
ncbi:hypothetical protein [Hufsiella ginkgonis]|uniref:Uncharacterized protein n=1 Tax=Hufsiella ginkgonis TaxID=2695274 RepID=A0A7K1XWC0_9SPHI|nr:hypothetical protein [Hufsiella ginkgonis]MXV15079.1 hypothetical protein [Hufsiella ginkgonis]